MLRRFLRCLQRGNVSPLMHYRISAGFHSYSSNPSESHHSKPSSATVFLAASALGGLAYGLFYKRPHYENCNWINFTGLDLVPSAKCTTILPGGSEGDSAKNTPSLRRQYNFIADVAEKVSPAVVCIKARTHFYRGSGSGFIVSSDGLIVTNEHVVRRATNGLVSIEMKDGRKYSGIVKAVDPTSDLALVKINQLSGDTLPTIKLGDSSSVRPGEWVIAMGSPLRLSNTVTCGIVSSTARKSRELGLENDVEYLQTDASITFGNSGGPLINLDGEAIGVNSMKVTPGISFAIPSDHVKKFLSRADELAKSAKERSAAHTCYVGANVLSLTPMIAAQLRHRPEFAKLDVSQGILIVQVFDDSPCYKAGIKKFDVIVEIDGKKVNYAKELRRAAVGRASIKCLVHRDGKQLEIIIEPKPLPVPELC